MNEDELKAKLLHQLQRETALREEIRELKERIALLEEMRARVDGLLEAVDALIGHHQSIIP